MSLEGANSGPLNRKRSGLGPDLRSRRGPLQYQMADRDEVPPPQFPPDVHTRWTRRDDVRLVARPTMVESFNCIEILANKCATEFVNKSTSQPARRALLTQLRAPPPSLPLSVARRTSVICVFGRKCARENKERIKMRPSLARAASARNVVFSSLARQRQ